MSAEQKALLQKARDSLQAARLLAGQQFYDFAVSRSYYAMFYLAEAILLEEEVAFSKHSAVIAAFGHRFAKTGRVPSKFHRYLIQAHSSRNVGDYDAMSGLSQSYATMQIARAEEFLELAESLLTPSGQP